MTHFELILSKVQNVTNNECWPWEFAHHNGKGLVSIKNRMKTCHSVAYTLRYGPVPPNRELGHTCWTVDCWNPEHVRPVTHKQNMNDEVVRPNSNYGKPFCPSGHEMVPENIRQTRSKGRVCIAFARNASREGQRKRRFLRAMSNYVGI